MIHGLQTKLDLLIQVDPAIQRAHNIGLALGDIKPNNILNAENGTPIFIDTDNYAYKHLSFDIKLKNNDCLL